MRGGNVINEHNALDLISQSKLSYADMKDYIEKYDCAKSFWGKWLGESFGLYEN